MYHAALSGSKVSLHSSINEKKVLYVACTSIKKYSMWNSCKNRWSDIKQVSEEHNFVYHPTLFNFGKFSPFISPFKLTLNAL